MLGLATYFTAGEQEVRAWTFKKGIKAPQAAGIIHSDFERGFIRAETVAYDDLLAAGTMTAAKEAGKVRLEGKEVAKLIEVSFKIESMSVPAFMQYLKDELVDRIGELVGSKVFTGNGTDEFKGVVTELSTTAQKVEYDATAGLKYTDLTTAFGMLKSQFANGAAIYANNATVWNKLATILDGNGNPIFIADPAVGGVGRLFGFPVKVDGGVPDNMFVFGNAKKGYAVNEVKPITVETDKDLKARTTQFLGHSIMDGAVTDERALVLVAPSA